MKKLMGMAKGTVKLGVTSMAGGAALGAMGSIPGMPAQASQTSGIAMTALNLANVGNLAKVGMGIVDIPMKKKKKIGWL